MFYKNARVFLTIEEKLSIIIECKVILEKSKEKRHIKHNYVQFSECLDEEINEKGNFFFRFNWNFKSPSIAWFFLSSKRQFLLKSQI